jgi:hypothetical protein
LGLKVQVEERERAPLSIFTANEEGHHALIARLNRDEGMYAENAPAENSDLNNARVFERCGVGYAVQYRSNTEIGG